MIHGQRDRGRRRKLSHDPNLRIVFGVTLVSVMGVSSITPAFPKIARALDVPYQHIGLLITAFTLPGILFRPALGILADRWGRKPILVPSLFLFGAAGGACALARDFDLLLFLRFLQGLGVASLNSLSATIIGDLYAGNERAAAMGYNASVLSVGTAGYPLIGGAMALVGWFYPFLLPLVAIPLGLLVLSSLDAPEPEAQGQMGEYLSGVWQSIARHQAIALFAVTVVTFIVLYGVYLTFLPQLMEEAFGASPPVIGLVMATASLSTAATSSQLGKISRVFREETLIKAAFALYALSLAAIPFAPHLWALLIPAVAFGIAQGINIPSVLTLLAGLAPIEQRGLFMSINGMFLRLGQTVGPLLMGAIFSARGAGGVFASGGALALATLLFALLWRTHGSPGRT